MTWRITAIVADGRDGAAQGALQAAVELDLGWGGWAPKGWHDDAVPAVYRERMREAVTDSLGMIARLNVQDADATLIVSFKRDLVGSTAFVDKVANQGRKAFLHLVLPAGGKSQIPDSVRTDILEWAATERINFLFVAGPREREEPGIQQAVHDALVWILEDDAAAFAGADRSAAPESLQHIAEPLPVAEAVRRGIDQVMAREIARAEAQGPADDELMARAAAGEPFWGEGKAPVGAEQMRGLNEFAAGPVDLEAIAAIQTNTTPAGRTEAIIAAAQTGAIDVETAGELLSDLAAEIATTGDTPDRVVIPLERVGAALDAGLDVEIVPKDPS